MCLGDPQAVVRESTEAVVGQFLDALIKNPDTLNKVPETLVDRGLVVLLAVVVVHLFTCTFIQEDLSTVVNVLAVHSHEDEPPLVRKISLIWLHEFVK